MEQQIRELIQRIDDLQPVMKAVEAETDKEGNRIEKIKYKSFAEYFNLTDENTGKILDLKSSEEQRNKMRQPLIQSLLLKTKNILEKNRDKTKLYDKFMGEIDSDLKPDDKYSWCIKVLLELDIISDAKILSFQALKDGLGIIIGVKQLSDSNIDKAKEKAKDKSIEKGDATEDPAQSDQSDNAS